MKQLKPTNLIAVEVPERIKITQFTNGLFYQEPQPSIDVDYKKLKEKYPKNAKLLGEVTKNGVQFDVELFVEFINGVNDIGFRNYQIITMCDTFKTPQESFQSLLQANNVEIPEGKKLLILLKK